MPIIMHENYLLEVTKEQEAEIIKKIVEENWNLLGDYCLPDHVETLRSNGFSITLYKIERRLTLVEADPDDDTADHSIPEEGNEDA